MSEAGCVWTSQEWEDSWDTSCGESLVIIDGTPSHNSMRFCCYCGRPLVESEAVVDAECAP